MLHEVGNFQVEFADEALRDSIFTTLSQCCEHSWEKIEKCYVKCDETPIVYAAVMLNPTEKHHWFKQEWQDGTEEQRTWIEAVKVQLQKLWRTDYKITKMASPLPASKDDERDLHIRLYNYKCLKLTARASPTDAFDSYLVLIRGRIARYSIHYSTGTIDAIVIQISQSSPLIRSQYPL